jgi:alkylhydroperoxidase family enzyme
MPRVTIPEGEDPMLHVWTTMARPHTAAAGALTDVVYSRSTLSLREFEAARTRIARINDCAVCIGWRSARDVAAFDAADDAVPEDFYAHVGDDSWPGFSERERLAAEFAERFALDHTAMDDDLWARLHAAYTDDELIELGLCVGTWLATGRFNRVFDIDGACRVPGPR